MTQSAPVTPGLRPSTYLVDLAVWAFGLWTVVCQLIVNAGGKPGTLIAAFVATCAVTLALLGYYGYRLGPIALLRSLVDAQPAPAPPSRAPGTSRQRLVARVMLAGAALWVLHHYRDTRSEEQLVWFAAPLFLLALAWSFFRDPAGAEAEPQPESRFARGEFWLWPFALACGAFTLAAHRPDTDEAFYLSVATSILRNPDQAVMSFDPVHGVLSWPLQVAAYRSHTIEPLAGVLGALTGVQPIYYTHMVFAGLAGFLTPFAWMRLFRELWPARAGLLVVLTLVMLVADGTKNQAFGNFAMVRMFQGKAIMLTAVLPVVTAYAIRLVRAPSPKRFGLLFVSQAVATGLSSIAIPLAPLVAGVAVVAALPRFGALRRLVLGALACAYPVALGAFFYAQMLGAKGVDRLAEVATQAATTVVTDADLAHKKLELLANIFHRVLSPTAVRWAYLFGLLLLPALGATPVLRRLAAAGGLLFFGLLANPLLQDVVAHHLFGPSTYWRVFWLLPLPAFAVTLALSVTSAGPMRRWPWLSALLAIAIVGWGASTLPGRPVYARGNGVTFKQPELKVKGDYRVAKRASELTLAGTSVLAEPRVSMYLGAFEKPVYAVFAKKSYLRSKHRKWRSRLTRCITRGGCPKGYLDRAFRWLPIGGVVVDRRVARAKALKGALHDGGFQKREVVGRYEIWTRAQVPEGRSEG